MKGIPAWPSVAVIALLAGAGTAQADLRYQPQNPAFGGSPHYGAQQMQRAQAQNATSSPGGAVSDWEPRSQQERFEERLQEAITRQITRGVRNEAGILDEEGNLQILDEPVRAGDFSVGITESADGNLVITTEDVATGERSEFTIGTAN